MGNGGRQQGPQVHFSRPPALRTALTALQRGDDRCAPAMSFKDALFCSQHQASSSLTRPPPRSYETVDDADGADEESCSGEIDQGAEVRAWYIAVCSRREWRFSILQPQH